MTHRSVFATLALCLLVTPAMAGTNTTGGRPSAHSTASASGGQGGAGGRATATGGNASATGGRSHAQGGQGGTVNNSIYGGGGGGGGGGNNGGPLVFVPDGTGQAPCGGGLGLGAAASAAGAGAGGTLWEFGDCKRLRESAALRGLAVETGDARLQQAALNELCQIDRVREAFGGTCPTLGRTTDIDAHKRDYCFTRHAGDVNQHLECNRPH